MERRTFIRAATAVGGLPAAACLDSRTAADEDYDIGMSTDSFLPQTYTVEVGTTVVWRNTSQTGHTVTAYEEVLPAAAAYFASGPFDSEEAARAGWNEGGGRLAAGEDYTHTFEVPGTYEYVCIPHERVGMTGTVEVRAPDAETGNTSTTPAARLGSTSLRGDRSSPPG